MKTDLKIISFLFFIIGSAYSQISYDVSGTAVSVTQSTDYAYFTGNQFHGVPGQPKLPVRRFMFLLPPDADLGTVHVSLQTEKTVTIPGRYDIRPVPPAGTCEGIEWPKNRTIQQGKDIAVYAQNSFFPQTSLGTGYSGQLRDYKLYRILFYPFRYNPVTKQLTKVQKGTIAISYNKIRNYPKRASYTIPFRTHSLLREMVVNYNEMVPEYNGYTVASQKGSGYVIITTSAIESGSGKLQAFVESKKRRGFTVEVVTQKAWGGGRGDRGADEIRNWLVDNYQSKNIEYVLLIGDPSPSSGDIPMKMTYPNRDTPTDFYYGDLSGNWDNNGNGKCGELADVGSGGIDHVAEVGVGRIPVYGSNYQSLDHILEKTITYENMPSADIGWRKKMMLAMKGYNAPAEGSRVGEAIKNKVTSMTSDWSFYRIYDDGTGGPELTGVSENFILYAMESNDVGVVEWMTHGSATNAASTMSVSGTTKWDDEHPSIVFCGSCLNAEPSTSNNLTYSLLKNGAIGAIGGTQTTWFSTGANMENTAYNSGCLYQFGVNISAGNMHAIDALNKIKAECTPSGSEWQNYVAFNLYGCPAIGVETNGDGTAIADNSVAATHASFYVSLNTINTQHLQLTVPRAGTYAIKVHSVNGRLLSSIYKKLKSGTRTIAWNGNGAGSQLCIISIVSKNSRLVQKVVILPK